MESTESKIEEIEARLIAQEHRLFSVLRNFFVERKKWEEDDPRREASVVALVWRLFSPATIIVGGGGIAAITSAFFLFQQNQLIADQNIKFGQQNDYFREQNEYFREQLKRQQDKNKRDEEIRKQIQTETALRTIYSDAPSQIKSEAVKIFVLLERERLNRKVGTLDKSTLEAPDQQDPIKLWKERNRIRLIGIDLSEIRVFDFDLSWVDFSDANLSKVYFRNVNLSNTKFSETIVEGSTFTECDLTEADFSTTGGAVSSKESTDKTSWRGDNEAVPQPTWYSKCDLKGADFRYNDFRNTVFEDPINLFNADFFENKFNLPSLRPSPDLRHVMFTKTGIGKYLNKPYTAVPGEGDNGYVWNSGLGELELSTLSVNEKVIYANQFVAKVMDFYHQFKSRNE